LPYCRAASGGSASTISWRRVPSIEAGHVKNERIGRRNRYTVDREHAMRHSAQLGSRIGALLEALT